MKVVVAGKLPPPIGGQNIMVERILDLLREEEELAVYYLELGFTKDWDSVRSFRGDKLVEFFRVLARLFHLCRQGGIDFILFPAGGPHFVPLVRDVMLLPFFWLASRRVVVHFHAAGLAEKMTELPAVFRFICRFAYRNFSGEGLVLTEFGRQDAEAAGLTKVAVIPNGVVDESLLRLKRTDQKGLKILHVGHLSEAKGTRALIAAFGQLAEKHRDARLILVGEPLSPYSELLMMKDIEASGAASQIEWRGVKSGEELEATFKESNLFVFCSLAPYESFGLALVEAMSWSLPLVVTDWRANLWVAGDDYGGVTATNCEGRLTESLAEALKVAISSRERWLEWGERNRKLCEVRYGLASYKRELSSFIRRS
ncbi:glycosyltransferase family 4 protein [Roseibacillus persicicus]|uniref:glycosyltransferase family 4 protein n=1 Tax=Roseibacillus persicicus TaxID=454148 RepID=UPI00398B5BAC